MGFFEKIKVKVKQSIEDVDWDELNSKKDDALQKVKTKTNEYKDEIIDKTKEIKEGMDKKYKDKIGEELYQKEKELKEREKKIGAKEKDIETRESLLNKNFSVPKKYVYVPVSLTILIAIAISIDIPDKMRSSDDGIARSSNISNKKPSNDGSLASSNNISNKKPPNNDTPYNDFERNVYDTYDGVDANDPNFDVGKYCLDMEDQGVMEFSKCLGLSAVKIFNNN